MSTRSHGHASRLRLFGALAPVVLVTACYDLKQYNGALDATVDRTLADVVADRRDAPDVRDSARPDAADVRDASDVTDASDIGDVAPDTACPEGQERCDGVCVDPSADGNNCGRCGNVCDTPENGAPTCEAGDCVFTCNEGFHACGAGCSPNDALSTCGDRCEPCPSRANAESACTEGACVFACNAGFADCDGDPENGCETSIETAEHCGSCALRCAEPTPLCRTSGGSTGCVSGCSATTIRCGSTCVDTTSDTSNCGACGRACLAPAGGRSSCAAGGCTRACPTGQHECDGRCTPDVSVSSCGARCAPCATVPNASASCAMAVCGFVCDDPFEDCDRASTNGCEVNLNTATTSCGRCGNVCTAPTNATPVCAGGRCGTVCRAGYGDCDADPSNGCETVVPAWIIGCGACGSMGCDDMNPCTDDSCDPPTGCRHTPNTATCDDGNACTTGDVCAAGRCTSGAARDCDDMNACTDDACAPRTGLCSHDARTGSCDDGDACTLGDMCASGRCSAGAPRDCDDMNACTVDSCAPRTGTCAHDNRPGSCDDGDSCTVDDTCTDGVCAGTPGECG